MTRTARTLAFVLALSLTACSDSATAPEYQAPDRASLDGIGMVGTGGRSDSTSTTTTSSDSTDARGIGMVGVGG